MGDDSGHVKSVENSLGEAGYFAQIGKRNDGMWHARVVFCLGSIVLRVIDKRAFKQEGEARTWAVARAEDERAENRINEWHNVEYLKE